MATPTCIGESLPRGIGELREQFMAVLGHDLRNPLAAIGAGAAMLRREPQTAKGERLLAMMDDSVRRMAGLIDDVLDLARSRLGGGLALSRDGQTPLQPALEHVVSELQITDVGRVITTAFDLGEPVVCDRGRIGQLLSNLVGNALTHGAPNEPIRVAAWTSGGRFVLSVANAGKPIPPKAMERLFQPFFRGEVRPVARRSG